MPVCRTEKSNKRRRKSHGFELSRTLSCKEPRKRLAAKATKDTNAYSSEGVRDPCLLWLTPNGDAERADVSARVKGAQ